MSRRNQHQHLRANGWIVEEDDNALHHFGISQAEFIALPHVNRYRLLKRMKQLGHVREAENLKSITNHLNKYHNEK